MSLFNWDSLPTTEPMPGFVGRFVHTDTMTLAYWDIAQGTELPLHQHPHEQVVNILEGTLRLSVAGKTYELSPGQVVTIPGGVAHSGKALTNCKVLDVFHPVRQDYQ